MDEKNPKGKKVFGAILIIALLVTLTLYAVFHQPPDISAPPEPDNVIRFHCDSRVETHINITRDGVPTTELTMQSYIKEDYYGKYTEPKKAWRVATPGNYTVIFKRDFHHSVFCNFTITGNEPTQIIWGGAQRFYYLIQITGLNVYLKRGPDIVNSTHIGTFKEWPPIPGIITIRWQANKTGSTAYYFETNASHTMSIDEKTYHQYDAGDQWEYKYWDNTTDRLIRNQTVSFKWIRYINSIPHYRLEMDNRTVVLVNATIYSAHDIGNTYEYPNFDVIYLYDNDIIGTRGKI